MWCLLWIYQVSAIPECSQNLTMCRTARKLQKIQINNETDDTSQDLMKLVIYSNNKALTNYPFRQFLFVSLWFFSCSVPDNQRYFLFQFIFFIETTMATGICSFLLNTNLELIAKWLRKQKQRLSMWSPPETKRWCRSMHLGRADWKTNGKKIKK